ATDQPWKLSMVAFDEEGRVLYNVDKPPESDLEYTWGICCWGPRFTELMHGYLQALPRSKREVVLSDVFAAALDQKLEVWSLCFDDGQYLDIGTADELDQALRHFHL
ncbi:MAG TPA: dTDP-glucose pyrophosphorylase, partial [Anaerolineae bacterium]|nr:dTDP-glucose pyrophosphorylase [Anaerolineae bacterium]